MQTIFGKGVAAYRQFKCSGQVYVNTLSPDDCVFNAPIFSLYFEPGSCSHWQCMSGGKIYVGLDGRGEAVFKDGTVSTIEKGTVLRINPGLWHHVRATDSFLNVLSIPTNLPCNKVIWGEQAASPKIRG